MLIPRFSLRFLLFLTTVSAIFCYALLLAARGNVWAVALTLAVGGLALTFLTYALLFLVAWTMAQIFRLFPWTSPAPRSPFADGSLPPQLVPPEDTQ